jgi:hypothetical protein
MSPCTCTAGAAGCLPHLLYAGALSEPQQVAVVHLVRSIMAQIPPNADVAESAHCPPDTAGKDCPVAVHGISRALANILAALALDPSALVKFANAHVGQPEDAEVTIGRVPPSPLCSAVTAELVPLLQHIIFGSVADHVFGSAAGLTGRQQHQVTCAGQEAPDWYGWLACCAPDSAACFHVGSLCKDGKEHQILVPAHLG